MSLTTETEFDRPPRVLTVGGTDPTGASGLAADLRALGALGIGAGSVVTAVTVQSRVGFSDSVVLPASVVGAEIDAALSDTEYDVIKTGMLASEDIVRIIAERVRARGSRSRLVLDPVLVSTTGRTLLPTDAVRSLMAGLLPLAALVTPNVPEAEALTGVRVRSLDDVRHATDILLAHGASAVLMKGGHLSEEAAEAAGSEPNEVRDFLRTQDGDEYVIVRERLGGAGFRGTGCTLASAISGFLAEGFTLHRAVEEGRDYVERAMRRALLLDPLSGRGPLPLHLPPVPRALAEPADA